MSVSRATGNDILKSPRAVSSVINAATSSAANMKAWVEKKVTGVDDAMLVGIRQGMFELLEGTKGAVSMEELRELLSSVGKRASEVLNMAEPPKKETLLHVACRLCYAPVIIWMLDMGADASLLSHGEQSCLHIVAGRSSLSLAEDERVVGQLLSELVKGGCKTGVTNSQGETALHLACTKGNLVATEWLLEVGKTDPNLANKKDMTALEYAVHQRRENICELLVKHGALLEGALDVVAKWPASEARNALLQRMDDAVKERAAAQSKRDPLVWKEDARVTTSAQVVGAWDVYRQSMVLKRHYTFVTDALKVCVVQANASAAGEHAALLVEPNTFSLLMLPVQQLKVYAEAGVTEVVDQIRRLLWTRTPGLPEADWRLIQSPCLGHGALLMAEARLCPRPVIAVGVISGASKETSEAVMMERTTTTPVFQRFLKILEGLDRGADGSTSTWWNGFLFNFYVAPKMSPGEQRQHVGNAPILLFFCEGGASPDAEFRGAVNSVAIVCKYHKSDAIAVSGFHRRWLQDFVPTVPDDKDALLSMKEPSAIRRCLFATMVNGFWAAGSATRGPYAEARSRLFEESITEIIKLGSDRPADDFTPNKRSMIVAQQKKPSALSASKHLSTVQLRDSGKMEVTEAPWPGLGRDQVIPDFCKSALLHIGENAIDIQGIFRVAGAADEVRALCRDWKEGKRCTREEVGQIDVHVCASALKIFLREMSPPLIPSQIVKTLDMSKNFAGIVDAIVPQLRDLPGHEILTLLFRVLALIDCWNEDNAMDARALARIMAPCLWWKSGDATTNEVEFVQFLITHWNCCKMESEEAAWSHGDEVPTPLPDEEVSAPQAKPARPRTAAVRSNNMARGAPPPPLQRGGSESNIAVPKGPRSGVSSSDDPATTGRRSPRKSFGAVPSASTISESGSPRRKNE